MDPADEPGEREQAPYVVSSGLRQRLDLIHHLIGFGRQMVIVTGTAGSGRSRLLATVAAESEPDWLVVELDGRGIETPATLLNILLDALEPGAPDRPGGATDLEARVCRQLAAMHSEQRTVVLIADDCDDFNDPLNALLFRLAHTDSGVGEMRIVASCREDGDYAERLQSLSPQASLLHLIEIPPLEASQISELAAALSARADGTGLSADTFARVLADSNGHPATVLDLLYKHLATAAAPTPVASAETDLDGDDDSAAEVALESSAAAPVADPHDTLTPPPAQAGSGLKRLLGFATVIGAAIALALLTVLNNGRGSRPEPAPAIEISLPGQTVAEATNPDPDATAKTATVSPAAPAPAAVDDPTADTSADTTAAPEETQTEAAPTTADSPPPGTGSGPGGDSVAADRPAAAPATPPTTAMAGTDAEPETPAADPSAAAAVVSAEPVPVETPAPLAVNTETTPDHPAAHADATPAAPATPSYTPEWLLTNPDNSYVIQLFGLRNAASARRFIERHQLQAQATVLTLEHNAAPWYVVVYGHYPDKARALAAIEALDPALSAHGAWARPVGSLKK